MTTILTESNAYKAESAKPVGDALWLSAEDCAAASGWTLKPEGLCKDDICLPIPKDQSSNFVSDGSVNLAAFWQLMDRPVLHDEQGSTWMLGAGHQDRSKSLESLQAPDFSLPDLDGEMHALSDFRGKRVFLTTWSSW
jgi:hypothetical protein